MQASIVSPAGTQPGFKRAQPTSSAKIVGPSGGGNFQVFSTILIFRIRSYQCCDSCCRKGYHHDSIRFLDILKNG